MNSTACDGSAAGTELEWKYFQRLDISANPDPDKIFPEQGKSLHTKGTTSPRSFR